MSAAQLVRVAPDAVLLVAIGIPAVTYALLELSGWQFRLRGPNTWVEALFGGLAGIMSGFAGVWAPPTVMYLTALGTLKHDQIRIQGVIYGTGAVALVGAHIGAGVLSAETLPFSVTLIAPALLGLWVGGQVTDRINQTVFRRATLIVLLIAGLNLISRAVFEG